VNNIYYLVKNIFLSGYRFQKSDHHKSSVFQAHAGTLRRTFSWD